MRLVRAKIENFRLLRDVEIGFEESTTLVVGRNNSGKTSIAELFRRLLSGGSLGFRLEDFSLGCHESFWLALEAYRADPQSVAILDLLPSIRLVLDIGYDTDAPDLGPLGNCIIDLNDACNEARLEFRFGPKTTAPEAFFASHLAPLDNVADDRARFFRDLGQRLPAAYAGTLEAVDPNDPTNRKTLETKILTTLVAQGTFTSNACIKDWFEPDVSPAQLLAKTPEERMSGNRRLAYQIPEQDGGPSARSFEDAFILANPGLFELGEGDQAALAYEHASEQKKSSFALEHAIENTEWETPRYIFEGLRWLAEGNPAPILPPEAVATGLLAEVTGVDLADDGQPGHG